MIVNKESSNKFDLETLTGKWFIYKINFPMWLKGDKENPSLNYSLIKKENETILFDEVLYTKNNKIKSIKGYDIPQNKNNTSFKWKGKGILALLSSKWKFVYLNLENEWAIIFFEKTLFTPKGYDVISKNKTMESSILTDIDSKLKKLGIFDLLQNIKQV